MSRRRGVAVGGITIALAAAVGLLVPSAQRADAVPATAQSRAVIDDTTALRLLLTGVRGASPLFCEMATRNVDGRVWWSSSGGVAGGALEVDSASAAVLRWIQREHADARMVPRLAATLRDDDTCVRRVGASLLGRVKHASATTALLAALDDPRPETRAVAALGLGMSEADAALQPLIRRLRDESAAVRRAAAWALGSLENKAAMVPLIELLDRDADASVRQAAAWAIGQVTG